jgi:hypothetical protein
LPVSVDHTVLRRDDLTRLAGLLGLQPLAVVRVYHLPPEIRVLAVLG